jgi:hypothetical protein
MRRLPVALAAGALAAFATTGALASERFVDPVGDVEGGAAPDITSIAVSHEGGRSVTFRVEFDQSPPLSWSEADGYTDTLMILLDTGDVAASIGDAEYVIGVHAVTIDRGEFGSLREGSAAAPVTKVDVAVVERTVSLSVPLRAIGDPAELRFWVGVGREASQGAAGGGASDSFPASGMQLYALGAPPATPVMALALVVAAAGLLIALIVPRRRARRGPAHPAGEDREPVQGSDGAGPAGPGTAVRG